MKILKTNTAVRIGVGPFLDFEDGVTPETGMTVTNITCELFKDLDEGSAVVRTAITLAASGSSNDMAHITSDVAGMYDLELTASQLNFLGKARLCFTDPDVCLPVWENLLLVPAAVFNALIAGSDYLTLLGSAWDVVRSGHATAGTFGEVATPSDLLATSLGSGLGTLLQSIQPARVGTAQGGGGSTITFDSGASSVNNFYNKMFVELLSGTGAGQSGFVASYVGSTRVATMRDAWITQPDNTTVFLIR